MYADNEGALKIPMKFVCICLALRGKVCSRLRCEVVCQRATPRLNAVTRRATLLSRATPRWVGGPQLRLRVGLPYAQRAR